MKINGKEYLSPQEQLFENTKDIEELKQVIKPVYQTTAALTSSSVSVALADTNVGDATEGWLMTTDGLLFKITANDGTTVLLIYYAKLSGEDGTNAIDDSTTSATKLWSSLKTNNEIAKAKDKGIYYALEEPTENTGVYTYTRLTLGNINTNVPIKDGDLVISFDATDISNVKSANMWMITDASDPDTLTVVLVGAVGGGKQSYQHNIRLTRQTGRYTDNFVFCLPIINDSIEEMTQDNVLDYLQNNGYTYDSQKGTYIQNYMPITGWEYDSNTSNTVYFYGIMYYSPGRIYTKSSVGYGDQDASIYTFEDNVIPFP